MYNVKQVLSLEECVCGSIRVQYISHLETSRKPMFKLGGTYYTVFSLSLEYAGN
jgi:hypothetical protein